MAIYTELIPDHYVGDKVSITIKHREKDSTDVFIMRLKSEIDNVLRELAKQYPGKEA